MSGYLPLKITGTSTGLVQSREEFILPDDAYPVLENAFVWRERIKRKQGCQTLGRFQRNLSMVTLSQTGSGTHTIISDLLNDASINARATQPNGQIIPSTLILTLGTAVFTDSSGNGILTVSGSGGLNGSINYSTGLINLGTSSSFSGTPIVVTFSYYPSLPVMGLRNRDLNSTNNQLTIGFDTVYAYRFSGSAWQEFIPGTTWSGDDTDFFWHTNYFTSAANLKLFWVTNFSGTGGDPIRYTDGAAWYNFGPTASPQTGQVDGSGNFLNQCLCLIPYRSRLVAFNTYEGTSLSASINFPQRIRWAAIGNPLTTNAWRSDIPGQGGFIDIPTNERLISVGFVRDNLVIYCSRSTWQLRYTRRTIQPFQLEKVNSELGAEGTFSTVQFDTSLVGIGDKGIVECDSYQSKRIDIKIPDLVFQFSDATIGSDQNSNTERTQGVRDFVNRLAFWTYVYQVNDEVSAIYPNRRLVYNYENDSWAIFTDSLTALGTFYPSSGRTWANTQIPWSQCNFPWANRQAATPDIIGGNQQGFVVYLDEQVGNDPTLCITNITGNVTTPTVVTSPNHNIEPGTIISIFGIPTGTAFANLNFNSTTSSPVFGVSVVDSNNLALYTYNPQSQDFSTPQLDPSQTYIGNGVISIRDNFFIQSKKFNYFDEGQSIQMGYLDILMSSTASGEITLQVYPNYDETTPVNTSPYNVDQFFNQTISTANPNSPGVQGSKYMQRIFCPCRANFLTLAYTLSNAQMSGIAQQSDVQIDAQILWQRKAGRITNR